MPLDDELFELLKHESQTRGKPFQNTLHDILRLGLMAAEKQREFKITPRHMGVQPGVNYDCTSSLLEFLDGETYK